MSTLEDAIGLAAEAHCGHRDKVGQPYVLHLLRVVLRLESEHERIAGVLHDLVEDTSYTLDDLRCMGYPGDVAEAVDCLTRRASETYEQFIERAGTNPVARRVKLADLEDNMDVLRLPAITEKDAARLNQYLRARIKELIAANAP
jgi:(p)ppGpp synthase/HD superfamily hydrolase